MPRRPIVRSNDSFNVEAESTETSGDGKFLWISGIVGATLALIGLIADIIAISGWLDSSQSTENISGARLLPNSFGIWLLYFFGISYTVLVFSYLVRLKLVHRLRAKNPRITYEKRESVEKAVMAITGAFGMPLFIFHFIFLFFIIQGKIEALRPDQLQRYFGSPDSARIVFHFGMRWFLLDILLSAVIFLVVYELAKIIYSAVDDDL